VLVIQKPAAPRKTVLPTDPALDRSDEKALATAWSEYEKTWDHTKLPVAPGGRLAVFTVTPLSVPQKKYVDARGGEEAWELIAYAITDIDAMTLDKEGHEVPFQLQREPSPIGLRLPEDVIYWIMSDKDRAVPLVFWARKVCRAHPEVLKSGS
jgi:hypothetical protein